jgi:hypothetical protein
MSREESGGTGLFRIRLAMGGRVADAVSVEGAICFGGPVLGLLLEYSFRSRQT